MKKNGKMKQKQGKWKNEEIDNRKRMKEIKKLEKTGKTKKKKN